MSASLLFVLSLFVGHFVCSVAIAQSRDRPGKVNGPAAVAQFPSVTVSGQTVPRPNTLRTDETEIIQRRTPRQLEDDTITKRICIGC
jgi:hypothetical protein